MIFFRKTWILALTAVFLGFGTIENLSAAVSGGADAEKTVKTVDTAKSVKPVKNNPLKTTNISKINSKSKTVTENGDSMKQDTYGFFDVRKFGAAGNGVTDDTAAIQKAIDQAAKVSGVVVVPPGRYITGELQLAPHVEIRGAANFSFRYASGSVLILRNDTTSRCLLNMTHAYGAKVHSLCLKGRGSEPGPDGLRVHGIMVDKKDYGRQEDTPTIDNCRVEYFSGDGIRLERIWCFSVRHSHMLHNGGDGLRVRGWDGFVIDNWLSGNLGAGYGAYNENASVTMTGNRIEWNHAGGIVIHGGSHYNITGNYIDRSGNAGIDLQQCAQLAVTGNVIYRSGKPEWTPDSKDSLH